MTFCLYFPELCSVSTSQLEVLLDTQAGRTVGYLTTQHIR